MKETTSNDALTMRATAAQCSDLASRYLDFAKTTTDAGERFEFTRLAVHCHSTAVEIEARLKSLEPRDASTPRG
jgi:hypothetical protein